MYMFHNKKNMLNVLLISVHLLELLVTFYTYFKRIVQHYGKCYLFSCLELDETIDTTLMSVCEI